MSDEIKDQVNAIIRDEIQEIINDYVDSKEEGDETGLGFVGKENEKELKVNISNAEVDRLSKEYKKIKKYQKSNLFQAKKLGLVDKNGKPLK